MIRDRTAELGHGNSAWPDEDEQNARPSAGGSGADTDNDAQYRDSNLERIKRQLKITGHRDVSAEELHGMLESGRTAVFTQNVLSEARCTRQALSDIESRRDEILKLEASIAALRDIVLYIDAEVQAQGETVDNIEAHVQQSAVYVEVAKEDAGKAVEYKRRRWRKRFWLALCLAVLATLLVFFLASVLGVDIIPKGTG